jgi:hypothetical protein
MAFFLTCFLGMFVGRRIGWGLSKAILYLGLLAIVCVVCALWGVAVAGTFRLAVDDFHPDWVLKVLGFGAAGYVSIPNYRLFSEVSPELWRRHLLVTNLPHVVFLVASTILALRPPDRLLIWLVIALTVYELFAWVAVRSNGL